MDLKSNVPLPNNANLYNSIIVVIGLINKKNLIFSVAQILDMQLGLKH